MNLRNKLFCVPLKISLYTHLRGDDKVNKGTSSEGEKMQTETEWKPDTTEYIGSALVSIGFLIFIGFIPALFQ